MKKTFQKLAIIVLLASLSLAVSACLKKPNPVVNQNQSINTEPVDTPNPYWTIDYKNWKTFINEEYGYQIDVPPGWEVEPPQREYSYIYINKKGEKAQFPLVITIQENSNKYSSKEFISNLRQEYEEYCQKKPCGSWRYDKEYDIIIGDGYKACELYNVFAYDQSDERIYLAKDDIVIQFSFPVAKENPNLDNPIENNALVHQALKTFKFIEKE